MALAQVGIGLVTLDDLTVTPGSVTVAERDHAFIAVANKLPSVQPATPSEWTRLVAVVVGTGADSDSQGQVRLSLFYRVVPATGWAVPSFTTSGTGSVIGAVLGVWRVGAGETLDYGTAVVDDTTVATSFGGTAGSNPGLTTGDSVAAFATVGDNPTFSGGAFSAPGATFGSATEVRDANTNLGNDLAVAVYTAAVSSGTATGAPSFTATLSGSAAGGAVLLRLRAVPAAPTVDAGADATVPVALPFTRTATENDNGSTITARAWTIVSGPAGVGTTIGTAAALSWTPGTSGAYVLRYSATNANGTSTDDVAVTVLPSYVRDFRVAQSNTSTVTVPHPGGAQVGDPMVAFCINDFLAATATGWTRDSAAGSSASDAALNIFRRVATAAETDHVFDVGASTSATVAVVAFNKIEVAETWDVAPALETLTSTASTTTPATPSITTVEAKALLLAVYGTVEASSGHGMHTPPAGMTELIDFLPAGTGRGLHVAAVAIDPAGATGTRTATTAGTAKVYIAQAMAAAPRTAEQISVTDTGTGTETLTVTESATVADSGTGTETIAVSDADTFTIADTATGMETIQVSDFTTETVDVPDTATGVDTVAVQESTSVADSGAGADTTAVQEQAAVADSGTGTETVTVQDTQFITIADTGTGIESIAVRDVPFTPALPLRGGPVYDLAVVARIPQPGGPPMLVEIDPIPFESLSYTTTLSRAQELSATCLATTLPDSILQLLRPPVETALELHLTRGGRLVFAGPLYTYDQANGEKITVQARGLLSYLRRMRFRADTTFVGVDQFAIVAAMIDQWQVAEYGHYGLDTSAVGASGVLRDGTYLRNELKDIGQRVEELGARINGFDIDIDPQTRLVQLWHPAKGVDRSAGEDAVVFDAQSLESSDVSYSVAPEDLASEAFGIGTGGDETLFSERVNVELLSKIGRSGVSGTFDGVSVAATLDDHTQAMLDARSGPLIVPGPKARITADTDLDTYAVGDTVRFEAPGPLGVAGEFRLRSQTVSVTEAGEETISIEFV